MLNRDANGREPLRERVRIFTRCSQAVSVAHPERCLLNQDRPIADATRRNYHGLATGLQFGEVLGDARVPRTRSAAWRVP